MVMMVARRFLVTRAAVAEIMLLQDIGLFEKPNRPIDGGYRYARIALDRALIDLIDIGMVVDLGQDLRDGAALIGHLEAFVGADPFDSRLHAPPHMAMLYGRDSPCHRQTTNARLPLI